MTVLIPYIHWFTVQQWLTHNYFTLQDYTHITIGDRVAVTFNTARQYASFYHHWQHVVID